MVILYMKYFDMLDIFFIYVTMVANKPYCLLLSTTMMILLWLLLLLLCCCYCSFVLFEKAGFTLKMHQMLSLHTTPKEFKNATIKGQFGFLFEKKFEKKLGQGKRVIVFTSSFSKSSIFGMFSVHAKTKSRRFQIPLVWKALSSSSVFVTG